MEVAKIKITGTDVAVSDLENITSGMIGATVSIEYDDTWEGLNKQVVFSGPLGAVNADGNTIPPEVLRLSGHELKVGVYGYMDDGSRAIPTIWASLGMIQAGTDPEGDETAAPTLPVWARMQNQIGNLDDLKTKAKTDLVAAINELASMGLNQEQIDTIIEQALTQAKESGEFDGAPGPVGPPGPQGEPGPQGPQGESAVVDEAEVQRIVGEYLEEHEAGGKADLAVNDPDTPGYVANRTHWIEKEEYETIIPEQKTEGIEQESLFGLIEGETYVIHIDGVEYMRVCEADARVIDGVITRILALGNIGIAFGLLGLPAPAGNGDSFFIADMIIEGPDMVTETIGGAAFIDGAEHTLQVIHKRQSIHKLPAIFMPEHHSYIPEYNLSLMGLSLDENGAGVVQCDTTALRAALADGLIAISFCYENVHIRATVCASRMLMAGIAEEIYSAQFCVGHGGTATLIVTTREVRVEFE